MIIAAFNEKDTYVTIYGLYQYDYGQVLRIQGLNLPSAVEMHFALQDKGIESITRVGTTKDGVTDVLIPDSMLENNGTSSDYKIYAFVYIADEISGKTERRIEMSVKSRPKPEAFDRPEDAELFREAIKAVNESAARSAESERQAEGWAHGREDLPEREQDNAKYYSEQAKEDSVKTDADRKEVERLVESVSGIDEQVETIRGYSEQAQTSATNAALSESAAKESENNAELAAQKAEKDKSVVEQAKDLVKQMGQEVLDNKNLVDDTVHGFELRTQQAVADVNNAGQTQTERVQTAGNTAVESVESAQRTATGAVETAKTEAIKTVQEEGVAQTGTVAAEGEKQVQAVQAAASEIVADRQQITQNKNDVTTLKEDLDDIAKFVKLTDIVKDKPFGYCNGVDDKSFIGNTLSGTFASGNFVEIGAVSDTYLKAGKKYRVAYRRISGSGYVIRTMSDYAFKQTVMSVGGAYPLDGFADVNITTDSNICISDGNGVINCELYVYDITDMSEDELSLINWENPIHNISVGIVPNAIEAEHSKTSDKALVAESVLSVDVNGLVNYSSRNLLDVKNCSVGLLSRGIVGENNGYITSNFMPVNDFVAYCNTGKTDIPINAIAFYTDENENSYIPDSQITVWSGAPSGYAKSDMPDDAKYFRVSVYKDYITGSAYKYQMFEKGTAKTHWQAYFDSYKSSENQVLFDKVIDTLGDSITEQGTWQGYVADALHTGIIYNHGIGGSRISGNGSNAMWQDSRINALDNDIDCLLIMGGTNDSAQNAAIGELNRENTDTNTFIGAYNVLLSKIFYKYYHLGSGFGGIVQTEKINPIQIMIATPIYCNNSAYGNMDNIATAVRGVSDMWGIPIADLHRKSGINSITSSIYLADDVHPNSDGGKRVANVWINALKTNSNLIV